MNLPYRALCLIHELSRPLTRGDWKTCKKKEADLILEQVATDIYRLEGIKKIMIKLHPNYGNYVDMAFESANGWSHYGRQVLLKNKGKLPQFVGQIPSNHYAYVHCFRWYFHHYSEVTWYDSVALKPFTW